jgi:hypothetical protein
MMMLAHEGNWEILTQTHFSRASYLAYMWKPIRINKFGIFFCSLLEPARCSRPSKDIHNAISLLP